MGALQYELWLITDFCRTGNTKTLIWWNFSERNKGLYWRNKTILFVYLDSTWQDLKDLQRVFLHFQDLTSPYHSKYGVRTQSVIVDFCFAVKVMLQKTWRQWIIPSEKHVDLVVWILHYMRSVISGILFAKSRIKHKCESTLYMTHIYWGCSKNLSKTIDARILCSIAFLRLPKVTSSQFNATIHLTEHRPDRTLGLLFVFCKAP